MNGESSAFGGPKWNDAKSKRLVGVPMEFENVCEALMFFEHHENINVKTQVIGLAVGKKEDLFPMSSKNLFYLISTQMTNGNFCVSTNTSKNQCSMSNALMSTLACQYPVPTHL